LKGLKTYIGGERGRWSDFLSSIEKRIELVIRKVDLLQARNWLKWRPKDQSGKEDCDTVVRFLFFDILPDGFLGFGLANAVGIVGVLSFDCIVD
jgi:hypothetical protein